MFCRDLGVKILITVFFLISMGRLFNDFLDGFFNISCYSELFDVAAVIVSCYMGYFYILREWFARFYFYK